MPFIYKPGYHINMITRVTDPGGVDPAPDPTLYKKPESYKTIKKNRPLKNNPGLIPFRPNNIHHSLFSFSIIFDLRDLEFGSAFDLF